MLMWHSREAPALWYVTSTVFDYGPFLFLQIFLYRITTAFKIKMSSCHILMTCILIKVGMPTMQ